MVAVIFEVELSEAHRSDYLDLAAQLAGQLSTMKGFISIERFASLSRPDRLLSLSFWESEEAITAWRQLDAHRTAQSLGREYIFRDYRLRVATVMRDYGLTRRDEAPADSRLAHDQG